MKQWETTQAMMTETIESNKDLLELNGLWLEKANATWWPVWKKQWETTLLMWEGRNIDWTTQMTRLTNGSRKPTLPGGPSGEPGCPNGKLTKANGRKSTAVLLPSGLPGWNNGTLSSPSGKRNTAIRLGGPLPSPPPSPPQLRLRLLKL